MTQNGVDPITADRDSRDNALNLQARRWRVRLLSPQCKEAGHDLESLGEDQPAGLYFKKLERFAARVASLIEALCRASMETDLKVLLPVSSGLDGTAAQRTLLDLLLRHLRGLPPGLLVPELRALQARLDRDWLRALELFDRITDLVEPMKSESIPHHERQAWKAALVDDVKCAMDAAFPPERVSAEGSAEKPSFAHELSWEHIVLALIAGDGREWTVEALAAKVGKHKSSLYRDGQVKRALQARRSGRSLHRAHRDVRTGTLGAVAEGESRDD